MQTKLPHDYIHRSYIHELHCISLISIGQNYMLFTDWTKAIATVKFVRISFKNMFLAIATPPVAVQDAKANGMHCLCFSIQQLRQT